MDRMTRIRERNLSVIYTSLSILKIMRARLGLEAMLEFQDAYIRKLENINPGFRTGFLHAMELVKVDELYKGTVCDEKDKKFNEDTN